MRCPLKGTKTKYWTKRPISDTATTSNKNYIVSPNWKIIHLTREGYHFYWSCRV